MKTVTKRTVVHSTSTKGAGGMTLREVERFCEEAREAGVSGGVRPMVQVPDAGRPPQTLGQLYVSIEEGI
jgi:hypothetical protein